MVLDPVKSQSQEALPLAGPALDAALLEFSVSAMAYAIADFGTLSRAILFVAAARACGPFEATSLRASRPISVNALAASLRRPFETTRRNANALIEMGLLARSSGGLHVPLQAVADPRVAHFGDHCHDLLVRLVDDLHAANMALPTRQSDLSYDPRAGIGIAFDLLLAGFECRDGDDRNLLRVALLTVIEWANRRPAMGLRMASLPIPIKASGVARILGLPYATAARNLDMLVREGALVRVPDGLVIPPERLTARAAEAARQALAHRARQLIGRLARIGFPLDRPSASYIQGRPTLPSLG